MGLRGCGSNIVECGFEATNRRCWRRVGVRWHEGEFWLYGSGTCKAQGGLEWSEVRLSEIREKKKETSLAWKEKRQHCSLKYGVNLGLASKCGMELCLSLVGA